MAAVQGVPRVVLKWILSLNLSSPVKSVRRDFSNGYLFAEILQKYCPSDVSLHSFDTASSSKKKEDNWKLLKKAFRRNGIPLSDEEVRRAIGCDETAVVDILQRLRRHLLEGKSKKVVASPGKEGNPGVQRHSNVARNINVGNDRPAVNGYEEQENRGAGKVPSRYAQQSHPPRQVPNVGKGKVSPDDVYKLEKNIRLDAEVRFNGRSNCEPSPTYECYAQQQQQRDSIPDVSAAYAYDSLADEDEYTEDLSSASTYPDPFAKQMNAEGISPFVFGQGGQLAKHMAQSAMPSGHTLDTYADSYESHGVPSDVYSFLSGARIGAIESNDGSSTWANDVEAIQGDIARGIIKEVVDFKPYTQEDYESLTQNHKQGYWELGKLGPDIDPDELAEKRAAGERRKNYAKGLRVLAQPRPKDSRKDSAGKIPSSREKALQFAARLPKPASKAGNRGDVKGIPLLKQERSRQDDDVGERYCQVTELERLEMQHRADLLRMQAVKAELGCISLK